MAAGAGGQPDRRLPGVACRDPQDDRGEAAGSIVSVASIGGKRGDANIAHYNASKFGVIGFTQALAQEVAAHDILVNAVCPGVVETPMIAKYAKGQNGDISEWIAKQTIARSQRPDEIAYAVAFLHTCRSITGQAINVDGGTVFY